MGPVLVAPATALLLPLLLQPTDSLPPFKWEPLPDPAAVCLDGSRYGLVTCVGTAPLVNVTIELSGGAWCYDEAECLARSFTPLGSSITWPAVAAATPCYAAPGSAEIHMNYGDGASFTGFRADAWPVPGNASAVLWFRGARNLDASLDYLLETYSVATAKLLIVSGASAGGLSTFLHLDHIAARMAAAGSTARVVGRSNAGYFLDAPPSGHYGPPNVTFGGQMRHVYEMQNSSGSLSPACQASFGADAAWKCIMAPHAAPFIETPWFALQSRFDTFQLGAVAMLPCANDPLTCNATEWSQMQAFGPEFMDQLAPLMTPGSRNGGFVDACLIHGSTNSSIDGLTNGEAFQSWLAGTATHGNWWVMKCGGSESAGPCDRSPICKPFPQ